jgi:hypothetical protein
MPKIKKLYLKIIAYFVVFLIFVFLSIHFFLQAKDSHREFNNLKIAEIIGEDMPVGFVIERFGIPEQEIYKELHLPSNHWNQHYTIIQVCKKNKLDCLQVVDNLNKKISK